MEKQPESEEDLLEHRTDGTDAFDTLYIGCEKFPRQQAIAMLGDINNREIADEKTIRQYAKGEQQERELRQNADASESHHGRPAQPHSREGRQRDQHVDPET